MNYLIGNQLNSLSYKGIFLTLMLLIFKELVLHIVRQSRGCWGPHWKLICLVSSDNTMLNSSLASLCFILTETSVYLHELLSFCSWVLNRPEDKAELWVTLTKGCIILEKKVIAIIWTDNAVAIWFVTLEGMIISTSLFSFLLKNMLKWLWCDFHRDLYPTKMLS